MIDLRPMTMKDADRMLEWKNYPETRKFAIASHDDIKLEDHLKWLEKNLQYFQIILCDGEVCGAVRVQDNEISIWIDRTFWGKGIATGVIKKVSKKGFTAKIVDGNVASMRCFIKCGYLPVSHQDGYYIFKK
ncbi:MAG: GNAT family N-acetyltransferase [Patescibacteria group bacterium]